MIGKALSISMLESKELRTLLKEEALKEFDFQPDVLYEAIKSKIVDNTTVEKLLAKNYHKVTGKNNFPDAVKSLKYLQFSVPVHLDKWNPEINTIPVAVLPADWNEATLKSLTAYHPDGSIEELSAKEPPIFPVVVVSEAERIDEEGNLIVDNRGIVLPKENRIHYTKALEMANARKVLDKKAKEEPFIVVLPDDSFARLEARIKHENFIRAQKEKQLLTFLEKSQKSHLKSALNNANVKRIRLTGFSDLPNTINLDWNNPTGLTLRFYIYATGYFNVNGVKTLKEKQLIKWSDNLKDAITLPYPYEYYNIWIEGRYYQGSLQAISNYLIVRTSERRSTSTEYVSRYYFSESKIKDIEGWYVNDLELKGIYTLATGPTSGAKSEVGYDITTKGRWSWYGWHVIDTERDMSSDEGKIFDWNRTYVGVTGNYSLFNNGVYYIRWREFDGNYMKDQALNITLSIVKLSVQTASNNDTTLMSEVTSTIGNLKESVYLGDEDLGEYEVTWWTPANTRYNPSPGFSIWQSFN